MPSPPVRRRLTRDARRAELLRAGEGLFSERPFEEVSIDDIAAAAGISKNLLYHYFAGKRELFLAVITDAAERMLAATEPDLTLPPMERLRGSLAGHLDFACEHAQGYVALMRGAGDEEVAAILARNRDHVVARTIASLPGRFPAEHLELTLYGWVGMVDAVTLRWVEQRALPREDVLELLVALFVSVLGAAAAAAEH